MFITLNRFFAHVHFYKCETFVANRYFRIRVYGKNFIKAPYGFTVFAGTEKDDSLII